MITRFTSFVSESCGGCQCQGQRPRQTRQSVKRQQERQTGTASDRKPLKDCRIGAEGNIPIKGDSIGGSTSRRTETFLHHRTFGRLEVSSIAPRCPSGFDCVAPCGLQIGATVSFASASPIYPIDSSPDGDVPAPVASSASCFTPTVFAGIGKDRCRTGRLVGARSFD
jgi:hypothetical protein